MSIDILEALAQEQAKDEECSNINTGSDDKALLNYEDNIHPEVVRTLLTRFGCDEETIEDVLFEFPNTWGYWINYFEEKYNEKRKIKG